MLAHGLERGKEVMTAAGSSKNLAFGPVRDAGWHLMGTARMGINPKYSVVNEWGRCHDVAPFYCRQQHICYFRGCKSSVNNASLGPIYCRKNQKKSKISIKYNSTFFDLSNLAIVFELWFLLELANQH